MVLHIKRKLTLRPNLCVRLKQRQQHNDSLENMQLNSSVQDKQGTVDSSQLSIPTTPPPPMCMGSINTCHVHTHSTRVSPSLPNTGTVSSPRRDAANNRDLPPSPPPTLNPATPRAVKCTAAVRHSEQQSYSIALRTTHCCCALTMLSTVASSSSLLMGTSGCVRLGMRWPSICSLFSTWLQSGQGAWQQERKDVVATLQTTYTV